MFTKPKVAPPSVMRRLLTWQNAIVILGMATAWVEPMLGLILVVAGIWLHFLGQQHDGGES